LLAEYYHILKDSSLSFIVKMLIHKNNKLRRQEAYQRYLVDYGRMTKENYKPFDMYYVSPEDISVRSAEDIQAEAEEIRRKIKGGR